MIRIWEVQTNPMFNKTHHPETFRSTPHTFKPVSPKRISELLEIEKDKFSKLAPEMLFFKLNLALFPFLGTLEL